MFFSYQNYIFNSDEIIMIEEKFGSQKSIIHFSNGQTLEVFNPQIQKIKNQIKIINL